uniref:Uncharacterized protein n=1 Tax=Phaeomonas parva TaxID=124430 RepID=A0A7S1UHA0_9STRA|mmetsp:Transcript_45124/g.141355  ORF Transcript_45124/g.141355 Transcript_45124/m.141355 type:complete len:155 (+) Transcript_45124:449-913(+)
MTFPLTQNVEVTEPEPLFFNTSLSIGMGDCGVANHEKLGADWLRSLGFEDKVAELVERHVDAKPSASLTRPTLKFDGLSDASKTTLGYQGGPMDEAEAASFESDKLFKEIVLMRHGDEQAKVPDLQVPTLEDYKEMMVSHVESTVTANAKESQA